MSRRRSTHYLDSSVGLSVSLKYRQYMRRLYAKLGARARWLEADSQRDRAVGGLDPDLGDDTAGRPPTGYQDLVHEAEVPRPGAPGPVELLSGTSGPG